ncbi:hypothetical protein [Veronia pacifica]|uniref:Uncharacterized protein n=1 Tax=Veronia pacifica TaxID=1080227 RepID=A0A1C3E514_9GAMM|nr:hypothetical protein [Veronia pacifica]ODA28337.1 hypothetical protein A8L45_23200 [Veronia pacifica]
MRRKRLNHYVDVIPKIFAGWRMGDDLEALSELPNGVIDIDILKGSATHSLVGNIELWIAVEISQWLKESAARDNIDLSHLTEAYLTVKIDTDKVKTHKNKVVMFHFDLSSRIVTSSKVYASTVTEMTRWHSRH